ncbi:MAG: M56 family metallopeptidase, partial [Oscillospiraceae bacterium]|nr:M56 family metallopeptidase [Oscillospiraceae bacterium]
MKAVLITSSILIVLIAALRPILRGKIDPRVQYALWLAAVLRLLIPVNVVDSAYSALALLERAGQSAPIAGTIEAIGQTAIPAPNLAPLSDKDAMDLIMKEREQNGQNVTDLSTEETFEAWDQVRDLQGRSTTLATLARKLARPVWLGGGLAVGLWFVLVNLRLRRKLRGALPVEADCPLPVYVTPELPSPCLCGTVRPAVYVTPAALENPDRLRHVLAHELTHCRHRDHWWALARCLCLCVYWFDPLVWWAAALSRQDCELACDEGAIRRLGEGERLAYGRTLVDMIAAGRTPLLQTATTMTGGKRRVRERIQLIARRPRTVIAAALALAVVLGLAVGCTFTGAPEGSPEP